MKRRRVAGIRSAPESYLAAMGLVVAAAVFIASEAYPDIDWTMGGPPGHYPRFLAVLLAVLSFVVFLEGLFRPTVVRQPSFGTVTRMASGTVILALAPVGIHVLGFLLAGILLSFGLMTLLVGWKGATPWRVLGLLLSAIGCTIVLFVVFRYLVGVRLPAGVLFD